MQWLQAFLLLTNRRERGSEPSYLISTMSNCIDIEVGVKVLLTPSLVFIDWHWFPEKLLFQSDPKYLDAYKVSILIAKIWHFSTPISPNCKVMTAVPGVHDCGNMPLSRG